MGPIEMILLAHPWAQKWRDIEVKFYRPPLLTLEFYETYFRLVDRIGARGSEREASIHDRSYNLFRNNRSER
jgi:hypothetical protein